MTHFKHLPNEPKAPQLRNAYSILVGAHEAASSLLDTIETLHAPKKRKGAESEKEQDLLRAMLMFACAGLDSMAKQMVKDALPSVIDRSEGARNNLQAFIARRIARGEILDRDFLAAVLASREPRDVLIGELQDELASQSLQSKDQIFRVAAYFDVASKSLSSDQEGLRKIFVARNQIIHEMDADFGQEKGNRRQRRKSEMVEYANAIFKIAGQFLAAVDHGLGGHPILADV